MRAAVRKWGNSPAVRLPAAVMAAARLRVDQSVIVRAEDGKVVIEPVVDADPAIDALLDGITDANLHGEVDFGPRTGREAW